MKTLHVLTFASLIGLAASVASAGEDPELKPRSAKVQTVAAAAPATPARISQQDRMRLCAKQATGKKGAERKAFMKTCLSKKA